MSDHQPNLRRQHTFRLEAVVLRHSDWGEADRLLWIFSMEMGKLRAIAKGVRKMRSRKAGHLEPFTRVNLLLARGRDLPLITQVETVEPYLALREDMAGITYASYIVELLDKFTYEEGENRGLFHLLVDSLARLNQLPEQRDLVVRYYEMRLLDLTGFRPQLFQCLSCQREIQPEDQYFSNASGGVLCPNCGGRAENVQPISMNALKYLRHFQRSPFQDAVRARLSEPINRELELLMQHYLTYLLERGLNTPPFLRRLRQADPDSAGG